MESLSGQTFQGFEIIIVDDGSTDNTAQIARQLADSWNGIHYIRQKNAGSAAAMNRGINRANGYYIAALDADDMMRPSRLELMLDAAIAHPHSVICDDMVLFRDGKYLENDKGEPHHWVMKPYSFETLIHKNTMHKGLLYPKQAWIDAGGYPRSMKRGREDWAFNVALGIKGWCGEHVEYGGYLYRREGQNRTLTNTTPSWREQFKQQLFGLFPHIYAGERPMGCCGKGAGASPRGNNAVTDFLGKDGMTLIRYAGGNAGNMTFWGEATGKPYRFGGSRMRGYVDNRDLSGFLNMWKSGRQLFANIPVPPPEKKAPVKVEEKVVKPEETAVSEVVAVADIIIEEPPTIDDLKAVEDLPNVVIESNRLHDIGKKLLKDIRPLFDDEDFNGVELQYMLNSEKSRKIPRSTVLDLIAGATADGY